VEEFFDPEIEARQRAIAQTRGFALQEHALSLYAECAKPQCEHRPPNGRLRAQVREQLPEDGPQSS
jgi:Fur family ferric uptake transcriptional regulator